MPPPRLARLLLFGYLAFLLYGSLYPLSSFRFPEESPLSLLFSRTGVSRTDALMNLLVYLPLGWLLCIRYPRLRPVRAALVGCGLSFAVEYLQAFVPGRFPSALDWALNTGGSMLGGTFASRYRDLPWPQGPPIIEPGARAHVGLAAVGTWVAAQTFPFVPSVDIDYLKEGLRPVWHVLQGRESFSFAQAAVYALATLSLSIVLGDCLRLNQRLRRLIPLSFLGILFAKVPIVSRQLSLEALTGALAGLTVSWRLSSPETRSRASFLAAVGAVVVDGLRSESVEAGLVSFNWSLFRTHLTNEVAGASDLLATAWPFLALAFVVSGFSAIDPRRAAVVGAAAIFLSVLAIEWVQQFLPGRTPDVTDAVIAAGAWVVAWVGVGGRAAQESRAILQRPASRN
jgi:VanZ family protein